MFEQPTIHMNLNMIFRIKKLCLCSIMIFVMFLSFCEAGPLDDLKNAARKVADVAKTTAHKAGEVAKTTALKAGEVAKTTVDKAGEVAKTTAHKMQCLATEEERNYYRDLFLKKPRKIRQDKRVNKG